MANVEQIRDFCLALPYVTEETPFGPDNLVYKVGGKMFALIPLDHERLTIALKNTPEKNLSLREEYEEIDGAYHFNKKHWVSVIINNRTESLCFSLIKESYQLVLSGLPKKVKESLC